MKPLPYQVDNATRLYNIFKTRGYAYLQGQPRTGKTPTSLLTCEKIPNKPRVLIICPKQAKAGWSKFLEDKEFSTYLTKTYSLHHYEQIGKIRDNKIQLSLNPTDYDLVLVDESHNFGALGVPSGRIKLLKALCRDLPHIHLSGTAIIESPCSIYSQMAISKFNPFPFRDFYKFHAEYGILSKLRISGRLINQYHKYKKHLLPKIEEFSMYVTQEEIGITAKALDVLHYVSLQDSTKALYTKLKEEHMITLADGRELYADTTMKLRTTLHMIESGIVKLEEDYIELGNLEKINYIKDTFGDKKGVGVMCHFIGERNLLKKHFKHIEIYSSTSHAEGVDLSHLEYFVILSSGYSGAKFVQRRDRIVNIKGSVSNEVHHILVKGSISEDIYNAVSKKRDFNNETFKLC